MPGFGVPVEPWQLWQFALKTASPPDCAKPTVPAMDITRANTTCVRVLLLIERITPPHSLTTNSTHAYRAAARMVRPGGLVREEKLPCTTVTGGNLNYGTAL